MMKTGKKIFKSSEKNPILEEGNIYFFYRPKTQSYQQGEPIIRAAEETQQFLMILQPHQKSLYRICIIGHKKLPRIQPIHEKKWALINKILKDPEEVKEELSPRVYETKTRGTRLLPAARPAGEGVYRIVFTGKNAYLIYVLEFPHKPGKVQKEMGIKSEASFVISVKNSSDHFPAALQKYFQGKRFIPVKLIKFLNYSKTEFIMIGAKEGIQKYSTLRSSSGPLETADIFSQLKLWRKEHPIMPLVTGEWV